MKWFLLSVLVFTVAGNAEISSKGGCNTKLQKIAEKLEATASIEHELIKRGATLAFTVFSKELGPPPPELGIVIPPKQNVSFDEPELFPSSTTPPFVSSSSIAATTTLQATSIIPSHFIAMGMSSSSSGMSTAIPEPSPSSISLPRIEFIDISFSFGLEECRVINIKKRQVPGAALNLSLLYSTLLKATGTRNSTSQYAAFTLSMTEIIGEYFKFCINERSAENTIYSLHRELVAIRALSDFKSKQSALRSMFSKTMCIKYELKKRGAGDPTVVQFFHNLTPTNVKDIFGFHLDAFKNSSKFSSLAFVIDTTGSMGGAIETAKKIISDVIKLEQDNPDFYILTPFNDCTLPGTLDFGPNTVSWTGSDTELKTLNATIQNITAHCGGDSPEYCFSGIMEAFGAQYAENLSLFEEDGFSQMIVITDAPPKDAEKKNDVINKAISTNTTIHFFLKNDDYWNGPLWYRDYEDIASKTGGFVVFSNFASSNDELSTLTSFSLKRTGNSHIDDVVAILVRRKRSSGDCYQFSTSTFTSNVNGFVNKNDAILRNSNSTTLEVRANSFFNINRPGSGVWNLCPKSSTAEIKASIELRSEMSFVMSYLIEDTSKYIIAEDLPLLCTPGTVMIQFLNDDYHKVSSLTLELLGSDGELLATSILKDNCSGTFSGDIVYPSAGKLVTFVKLRGKDDHGYSFQYKRKEPKAPYSFVAPGNSFSWDDLSLLPHTPNGIKIPWGSYFNFTFTLISLRRMDYSLPVKVAASSATNELSVVLIQNSTMSFKNTAMIVVSAFVKATSPEGSLLSFVVTADFACNVRKQYEQMLSVGKPSDCVPPYSLIPPGSVTIVAIDIGGTGVAQGFYKNFTFTLLSRSTTTIPVSLWASTSDNLTATIVGERALRLQGSAPIVISVRVNPTATVGATLSFIVTANATCGIKANYVQTLLVLQSDATTDACGGCRNGGTCKVIIGKNRCVCTTEYSGLLCQTRRARR